MRTTIALLLLTTVASAQEPSEETKTWALKRAYELNGNSMVGCDETKCRMIDLSAEVAARSKPDPVIVPSVPVEKKKHK